MSGDRRLRPSFVMFCLLGLVLFVLAVVVVVVVAGLVAPISLQEMFSFKFASAPSVLCAFRQLSIHRSEREHDRILDETKLIDENKTKVGIPT